MKLHNKKTGEIVILDSDHYNSLADFGGKILIETNGKEYSYDTLAELNEEWEDYKPAEPLIKDEKVRKAVRAWADVCGVDRVVNGEYSNELCAKGQQFYGAKIVLTKTVALPRGRNYTIAELCGEEVE